MMYASTHLLNLLPGFEAPRDCQTTLTRAKLREDKFSSLLQVLWLITEIVLCWLSKLR